jgi:hypothetical protein
MVFCKQGFCCVLPRKVCGSLAVVFLLIPTITAVIGGIRFVMFPDLNLNRTYFFMMMASGAVAGFFFCCFFPALVRRKGPPRKGELKLCVIEEELWASGYQQFIASPAGAQAAINAGILPGQGGAQAPPAALNIPTASASQPLISGPILAPGPLPAAPTATTYNAPSPYASAASRGAGYGATSGFMPFKSSNDEEEEGDEMVELGAGQTSLVYNHHDSQDLV